MPASWNHSTSLHRCIFPGVFARPVTKCVLSWDIGSAQARHGWIITEDWQLHGDAALQCRHGSQRQLDWGYSAPSCSHFALASPGPLLAGLRVVVRSKRPGANWINTRKGVELRERSKGMASCRSVP